ncbi:MAG: hypothetical protein IJR49_00725, partial [Treponema sp.]|nr:hypothetical protein [Treponema sp.]
TPDIASYLSYSADTLTGPEDFKWSNVRSTMYTLKFPISLTSNLTYGGNFFSMTNAFSYSPTLQKHPHISTDTTKGGYSASAAESIKLADYQASKQELVNTNTIKFMPFYYIDMFKNTSISYTSAIKFLRTEFIGDADNPEWKYLGPDWTDAQSITSHKLDFTYSMTEGDKWKFSQSLSFSMVIPPQLDDYTGTLSLTFPFTTFTLATGVKKTSKTDPSWKKKPLQQALSLSFFNNSLRFTQSYNYDLENKHHDGLKLSISWKDLQASYTMMYTKSYDFDSDAGWVQKSEESFLPYSFSFSYTPTTKTWFAWKNRISIAPGLSTSIVADLVRPTNSYFLFTPSLSFKINDFLTLTFSSTSRNGVLYRYVQKALGHEGRIPGETNIFVDLWNSFRFDKEEKRRASGFKLKSLDFSLVHELHDWTLEFKYKMEPRLITDPSTNQKRYDFSPFVSFSVVWKPMASMKTRIRSKTGSTGAYDEWEFD